MWVLIASPKRFSHSTVTYSRRTKKKKCAKHAPTLSLSLHKCPQSTVRQLICKTCISDSFKTRTQRLYVVQHFRISDHSSRASKIKSPSITESSTFLLTPQRRPLPKMWLSTLRLTSLLLSTWLESLSGRDTASSTWNWLRAKIQWQRRRSLVVCTSWRVF